MAREIFCVKCRKIIDASKFNFCPYCGEKIELPKESGNRGWD